MTTRNQILDNIKAQFKKLMFADTASTQVTTNDGKTFIILGQELAIGCEIYLLNQDNTQTPVDNGDYNLSDGTVITVTDNKISNITAPDAAQATESPVSPAADTSTTPMAMGNGMPDAMPDGTDAEDPADVQTDMDTEARISALEQQIQEIMQMLSGTMNQTEKMMASHIKMSEVVEKIAAEPAGTKATNGKKFITDRTTDVSNSMDEIRAIQKRISSIKG
jgi:hypothetical protein